MTTPFNPTKVSQSAIVEFLNQCKTTQSDSYNIRESLRQADLLYMRETDQTIEQYKAKMANRFGDATKYQNVTIPIVAPQVEAAVAYQQSVFLSGYPIFGAVSIPGLEDAATQMDTIIGEHQTTGKWVPALLRALRKGFKYNLSPVEIEWCRTLTYSVETSKAYRNGEEGQPKKVIWQGNKLNDLDPYNTYWDLRCAPNDVAEWGEFAGYTEIYSRIRLKKFIESLPLTINVKEAFESQIQPIAQSSSGIAGMSYYVPLLNPDAMVTLDKNLEGQGTDWFAWAGLAREDKGEVKINYKNIYQVDIIYGRILPSDFNFKGVPGPNIPQVWKFVVVNGQVVIYAERMTNAHDMIPIVFAIPKDDGLAYQTKTFSQELEPFQHIASALTNSNIAARRRAIYDRVIYDSTRVSAGQINNDNPISKIPVKPSAFGGKLQDAVYAFPFQDGQFQINSQEMSLYMSLANQTSGLNQARQGQFVKGNKTRREFEEIMANANGRDQSVALTLEGNFFMPMKRIIKYNILQYQGAGTMYNPELQAAVTIQPETLRKADVVFKLSDGLIPSEKLIDGDVLSVAFTALGNSPQLAQAYNLAPMFSYLLKSQGARLKDFEKSNTQIAYEQAMMAWQQTVTQIFESALKANPPKTPEEIQKMLPPQPKPEDYGFDPKNPRAGKEDKSILQQVNERLEQTQ